MSLQSADPISNPTIDKLSTHLQGLRARSPPLSPTMRTPPMSPPSIHAASLHDADSGDEDLIGVMSVPGTPWVRSRATSRQTSRATSPTRLGAASRRAPGPLLLSTGTTAPSSLSATGRRSADPLRAFPTEVNQVIFALLRVKDLKSCARVSKKWFKSQTLNYIWFQHYRKDNFQDNSLPPGKWTRRESKQNWRVTYLQIARRSDLEGPRLAAHADAISSGVQTPREVREARWKQQAEVSRPGKLEMREMYKDLNGRKSRDKGKFGVGRDKGGWDPAEEGMW